MRYVILVLMVVVVGLWMNRAKGEDMDNFKPGKVRIYEVDSGKSIGGPDYQIR